MIRPEWLARTIEPVEPELPSIDPHRHLRYMENWGRYLLDDFGVAVTAGRA